MVWGPFLPGWKVDPLSWVFPTGSSDCSHGGWLSFTERDSCGGKGSLTKPYPAVGGLDASSLGFCSVWALRTSLGSVPAGTKRGAIPSCRGRVCLPGGHSVPRGPRVSSFLLLLFSIGFWLLVFGLTAPVTVVLGGPVLLPRVTSSPLVPQASPLPPSRPPVPQSSSYCLMLQLGHEPHSGACKQPLFPACFCYLVF